MINKLSIAAFGVVVALTAPLQAVAQQTSPTGSADWYGPGPWHMWGGYGFWWGPFFMMILVPLAICFVAFLVMRRHGSPYALGGHGRYSSHSALEILNERFAKGEIQQAEFETKRAAILRGR